MIRKATEKSAIDPNAGVSPEQGPEGQTWMATEVGTKDVGRETMEEEEPTVPGTSDNPPSHVALGTAVSSLEASATKKADRRSELRGGLKRKSPAAVPSLPVRSEARATDVESTALRHAQAAIRQLKLIKDDDPKSDRKIGD